MGGLQRGQGDLWRLPYTRNLYLGLLEMDCCDVQAGSFLWCVHDSEAVHTECSLEGPSEDPSCNRGVWPTGHSRTPCSDLEA